jgi:hypothetical protein
MKNRTLVVAFLLSLSFISVAQKDTVQIGLYINSLYDFKLDDKSFKTSFWMWALYKNDSLSFENTIELPNSKAAAFSLYTNEKKGNQNWTTQKCDAEMMHEWNVRNYPFDTQRLQIILEDTRYDTSALLYIADTENTKLDSSFGCKEWCIEKFTIQSTVRTYQTTYGNPELKGQSSYPRITVDVLMRRSSSWLLLFKMLTGAYVAFLISCMVFFISSANQDSRFGLCVGGLFAAIGNKYIVESTIPTSTTNTLMDNVHNLTFMSILLIVFIIILSLHLYDSENPKKVALSKKIDRVAFYSIIGVFAIINFVLIYQASR